MKVQNAYGLYVILRQPLYMGSSNRAAMYDNMGDHTTVVCLLNITKKTGTN